jgi:hypothetical protein
MSNNAWEQTADDGRFRCWVEYDAEGDGYSGTLHVEVVETGELLTTEKVGIAYAARFGPDVDDVAMWQENSVKAIDEWIARHEGDE